MSALYARAFWTLVMGLLFAATVPLLLAGIVKWER